MRKSSLVRSRPSTGTGVIALSAVFLILGSDSLRSDLHLEIIRSGQNVELTWSHPTASLEQSSTLIGDWVTFEGAVSPYLFPITNGANYFRLRLVGGLFGYRYLPPTFTTGIGDPSGITSVTSPENPSSLVGVTNRGKNGLGSVPQDNGFGSVMLHNGEFTHHALDMEIPGRGIHWRFERRYRSGMQYDGPLGHGWDFNYNQRLVVEASGDVLRMDGLGRADRYVLAGDSYQSPAGYYARLTRNPDGTFDERDRHGMVASYSQASTLGVARLTRLRDRNANEMTFDYNPLGQLTNIVDTLGRSIAYSYDDNGRLTQVTDFTNRTLKFGYDANGNLASATSPTVTGTPNGNDFPAGKTTNYTYSSGFGEPQFNHNLLTITAPNEAAVGGPPRLVVQYDTNPVSAHADRVQSLSWGGTNASGVAAGGTISYAFTGLGSAPPNDFITAVTQTTVTNRNGSVADYRFNQLGNLVRHVQSTRGLRPGEPAGFTNQFEYNGDGELTRRIDPEGSSMEYNYDSANPDRLQQGNLLEIRRLPGPRGGDQPQLVTGMSYETSFNFMATSTDPRGNTLTHTYDASGNRTRTVDRIPSVVEDFEYNAQGQMTAHVLPDNGSGHRRRDAMTYYSSGPQLGYLQTVVADSSVLNLTANYEYDAAGNVVRIVDSRGNDTLFTVNALNQIVREQSRPVATDNGPVRYQRDFVYDANNNLVRSDVMNRDETGALVLANPAFTTTHVYDILDDRLSTTQEVDPAKSIATAYAYDGNQNRTLIRFGEATAAGDPFNMVQTLYDERDLVFRVVRGPGSSIQSTNQTDYDGNANVVRTARGTEDAGGHATLYAYDGYDRRLTATDPMGNVTTWHHDPNGNVLSDRVDGELADMPGGAANVRLSETNSTYDAMDRRTRIDAAFFDTETQVPIGDGQSTTQVVYSGNSQVLSTIDDNFHPTATAYDTANRRSMVTDPKGNTTTFTYDANNNVTHVTEVETSDLGSPASVFITRDHYDNLDRLVQTIDNGDNTSGYAYDSRGNRVLFADARGNATRHHYDGLNRLIRTVRDMNGDGPANALPGDANPDIVTVQSFDDSSRLINQIDDNGNAKQFTYDALNRLIVTQLADGTTRTSVFDVHDNRISGTDANGTVVSSTYDLLDRVSTNSVAPAPGVLGTTLETFLYDGCSRLTRGQNDHSIVTRSYDSRAALILETQQVVPGGPVCTVIGTYDGEGNLTQLTYPGGRVVTRSYDAIDLPTEIADNPVSPGTFRATYAYIGRRTERRDTANGLRLEFQYDGLRRAVDTRHSQIVGGMIVAQRSSAWDPVHNKVASSDPQLIPPQPKTYQYDAGNRLQQSQSAGAPAIVYSLDGVGNRVNVSGTVDPGPYSMDATTPEPADQQVNQYTTTSFDSRAYDRNGNPTSGAESLRQFAYDFRNRLVQFTDLATGQTTTNKFDCLGRRIEKQTTGGAATRYYHLGSMEVEEQIAGVTIATYVRGAGTQLVGTTRNGADYYYLCDDQGTVLKLTDAAGNVVEHYEYADYGMPSFFDAFGAPLSNSTVGNPRLFRGQRYESETGFGFLRGMNLDHRAGRMVQRSGSANLLGNAYTYAGDNPLSAAGSGVMANVQRARFPFRTGIPMIDDPEGVAREWQEEQAERERQARLHGGSSPGQGVAAGRSQTADPPAQAGAGSPAEAGAPGLAAGSPSQTSGGAAANPGGSSARGAAAPVPALTKPPVAARAADPSGESGVARASAGPVAPLRIMYVGVSSDNPDAVMFDQPDNITGETVGFLYLNDVVEVLDDSNKYFIKVRIRGIVGWVAANVLTSKKVEDVDAEVPAGTGASGAGTAAKG